MLWSRNSEVEDYLPALFHYDYRKKHEFSFLRYGTLGGVQEKVLTNRRHCRKVMNGAHMYATFRLLMGQHESRFRTQKLINDEKSLVVKIA